MVGEEHVFELIPSYALQCLDESDEIRVAEHIAICADCRNELQAYQRLVDELPDAVELREPPAQLKMRILQRARESRAPSSSPRQPVLGRMLSFLRGVSPIWGAASLVLILLLGINNLYLWQRVNSIENAPSGGLMTLALTGSQFSPNAIGTLVISKDGEHGTLVVDGLPVLDEEHQFQVWLIRDGARTSGGVFSVDRFGYGALWIKSPEPLKNYQAFGVTIEPTGGSLGPTGDKVLGGEF